MEQRWDSITAKGLSYDQYQRIVEDIRDQPEWRKEADKAADYYDGNQLDAETLSMLEERGMAPLITNLIKPNIDLVLGLEAKTRSDWRVIADTEEYQDVAEALSQRLHEVERETRADRACSDAYAGMVKTGVGWVEVSRESDPFKYPYRVNSIHRREMYWDWLAKDPDLSDARYIIRKRWFDYDVVALHFPKQKKLLEASRGRWDGNWLEIASEDPELANAFDQERGSGLADYEWQNADRQRICLFEVWYKAPIHGVVLRIQDRTIEFDPKNDAHRAAVEMGLTQPIKAVYQQQRLAIWAGPHRLYDGKAHTKRPPYVPFWGFKEDLTGVPYGLIRNMISPQDEINARRRKLMNLLSSKRIIADSDALDTRVNSFRDVADEVARPDSIIVLNPNRRNANAFLFESDLNLSNQQFEIMKDAEAGIQNVTGIHNAMMGSDSQAKSGLAINSLVEQGTTTLAELSDNYRYSRRMVGEMLVDMIREDMREPMQIIVGEGKRKRPIQLNVPVQNPETGMPELMNDVGRSQVKVALEDVPSTPSYRAQQMTMLTQVIQAMPPEAQAIMAPAFVELSELPNRQELADQMRQMMGIQSGEEEQDPEKQQMMQQLQQYEQAIQQLQQAPQMIAAQTKQAELELKAQDQQIRSQQAEVDMQKTMAEIEKIQAETARTAVDIEMSGLDAERRMIDNEGAVIGNRKAMLESELEGM